MGETTINFSLPAKWVAKHFWRIKSGGAFGISVARCFTCFAFGLELIWLPETKGLALMLGPFWVGVARYKPSASMGGE